MELSARDYEVIQAALEDHIEGMESFARDMREDGDDSIGVEENVVEAKKLLHRLREGS